MRRVKKPPPCVWREDCYTATRAGRHGGGTYRPVPHRARLVISEQRCARVELGGVRIIAEEHRLAIGRHVVTQLVAVSDDARED